MAIVTGGSSIAVAHKLPDVCPRRPVADALREAATVVVVEVERPTRDLPAPRPRRGTKPTSMGARTTTRVRVREVLRGKAKVGRRIEVRGFDPRGKAARHVPTSPRLAVGTRYVVELSAVKGDRASFAGCGELQLVLPAVGDDPAGDLARWRVAAGP